MNTEVLSVGDVARILGVSEKSVRDHIQSGEWDIPHIKTGTHIKILRYRFFRDFLGYPDEGKTPQQNVRSDFTGSESSGRFRYG